MKNIVGVDMSSFMDKLHESLKLVTLFRKLQWSILLRLLLNLILVFRLGLGKRVLVPGVTLVVFQVLLVFTEAVSNGVRTLQGSWLEY